MSQCAVHTVPLQSVSLTLRLLWQLQARLVKKPCHACYGLHLKVSLLRFFEDVHCNFPTCLVREQGISHTGNITGKQFETQNPAYHEGCIIEQLSDLLLGQTPTSKSGKETSPLESEAQKKAKPKILSNDPKPALILILGTTSLKDY